MRAWFAAAFVLVAAVASWTGRASEGAPRVFVAKVSGGINPAVSDYLVKAIRTSEAEGAEALVIELDTPGGLLSSTKDIVTAILNADVAVIVFVSPRGAWAASAGTFITLAGHVAAMAPGTSIGAAHPVPATGTPPSTPESGDEGKPAARDVSGEKIENFTAAFAESIAEARDRNVEWAIQAVRKSVAIKQSEALEKRVIDLVADDLDHLLERVDGRTITVGRREVTLRTGGAETVVIEMDLVNRVFDVISNPTVAMLLFMAGLAGIYAEVNAPGLGLPGLLGVICLVLAGLAFQVIPFNWIGLILILCGVGLLVAELFVPSFGVLFGAGLACLGAGAYLVFRVPELSDLAIPFWPVIAPMVVVLGGFFAIVVFGVSRSYVKPQVAGAEGLVGEVGIADADFEVEGRVDVRGELWNARTSAPVRRGSKVRVVGVEDLVVRVNPISDAENREG